MKIHSLRGPKEVVAPDGTSYDTGPNDDVDVPDELGASLLEQVDSLAPVKSQKKEG